MKSFIFLGILLFSNLILASNYDGNYQTLCLNLSEDDLISKIEISGESLTKSWTAFEDSQCQTAYLKYVEKLKFKITGINLDGVVVESGYQPLTDETARALNQVLWCGYSDWKVGVYKETSGKMCGDYTSPQVGDELYSIIREEVSMPGFRLGVPSAGYDGKSIAHRHQEWADFWYFQL